MGLLTDFILMPDADLPMHSARPKTSIAAVHSKNIDYLVFAPLYALVMGVPEDVFIAAYEATLTAGSEQGPWLYKLPEPFVARLSGLTPEAISGFGERWARSESITEAFQAPSWAISDVQGLLGEVCALARLWATRPDTAIFYWVSL